MILYTEKQLQHAYIDYLRMVRKNNFENKTQIKEPTLEEFRLIYEDTWEMYYEDGSS